VRIGVVGAGISGLAAAHTLKKAGADVVVFEKSRAPGGRIATRRLDGFTFDTGATSIAPRGMSIEEVMLHELDTSDLIQIEKSIFVHTALRVSGGDIQRNAIPRYTYRSGNTRLAKLLAAGVEVRYEQSVSELQRVGSEFRVLGEAFDGVILTPPIPQTSTLLWTLGESRPVANARYRSCLSVLLGFAKDLPILPYHALLDPEQRHPLTFLSVESQKCPGRAPDGGTALVAQMSPGYSFNFYRKHDQEIVDDVLVYLGRLYGEDALGDPVVQDVKRWKYSQPDSVAMFESVNEEAHRLVIAGDGVIGGRVESAYESGVRAARLLLEYK
jgi:renalase